MHGSWSSLLHGMAKRRSIRATLSTSAVNLLVLGINLGTGLLTAKFLGPQGRGELAAMILWPQFIASLITLGLPQATTFTMVREPGEQRAIAGASLVLSVGLGLIASVAGVALIPLWLTQYDASVVGLAQAVMLLSPVILFMWSVNACLQAHGLFALYNRNLYLQPALALAGLLALTATDHFTPHTAALATMLAPLPVFVTNLAWLWRHQRPRLTAFLSNTRLLLRYGLRSCGIQILGTLALQFDSIFVLRALNPAAVGLYMVARSAAKPTIVFANALNTVLFPKASALARDDAVELAALATRVGIVVAAIVTVPLAMMGPYLISLLYGHAFLDAAQPFQLLVVEGALSAVAGTLAQAFMTVGRPGVVASLQLVSFLTCVALLIVLVPACGIYGASAALLIGTSVRLVITLVCFPLMLRVPLPRLWLSVDDLRLLVRARAPAVS
ncbi:MAG: oligosaccharide flippase family protein [Geminicoccaceae bacterium]